MNSAELRELAEACEKATGPDRELDAIIYGHTLGGIEWIGNVLRAAGVNLGSIDPGKVSRNWTTYYDPTPRYTASLDAAMSLVPEDTRWTLGNMRSPRTVAVVNSFDQGSGANPALALCAAALRAMPLNTPSKVEALPQRGVEVDEYMSVTLSRDGVVTSHNAYDANFDEMVEATRTIIETLQTRLDNRLKCPFASGNALREIAYFPPEMDAELAQLKTAEDEA